MKKIAIAAVMTAGLALSACEANVTEEGEMPSMDVDVSGDAGQLPEIDVETADVEVGTEEVTVDVPDVDVKMPSEE
ncbi:hypothetical protein C8024_04230 [Sphingopyxis sp. BSNA05]|uniref:hypothetical protein n=1 Tax=Sphingomonadales TaxID=204457 RepID=UPI000C1DF3DF|nr:MULTISPECIES: hypothetical protein [Sphingomonadaceae]ATW03663.1 hypothetical protein CHN51_09025 [Sphingorhabdus sp. YGSMI21]NRD88834.1 hypothetical protein [Sphingopyxis sp. BSNA05]